MDRTKDGERRALEQAEHERLLRANSRTALAEARSILERTERDLAETRDALSEARAAAADSARDTAKAERKVETARREVEAEVRRKAKAEAAAEQARTLAGRRTDELKQLKKRLAEARTEVRPRAAKQLAELRSELAEVQTAVEVERTRGAGLEREVDLRSAAEKVAREQAMRVEGELNDARAAERLASRELAEARAALARVETTLGESEARATSERERAQAELAALQTEKDVAIETVRERNALEVAALHERIALSVLAEAELRRVRRDHERGARRLTATRATLKRTSGEADWLRERVSSLEREAHRLRLTAEAERRESAEVARRLQEAEASMLNLEWTASAERERANAEIAALRRDLETRAELEAELERALWDAEHGARRLAKTRATLKRTDGEVDWLRTRVGLLEREALRGAATPPPERKKTTPPVKAKTESPAPKLTEPVAGGLAKAAASNGIAAGAAMNGNGHHTNGNGHHTNGNGHHTNGNGHHTNGNGNGNGHHGSVPIELHEVEEMAGAHLRRWDRWRVRACIDSVETSLRGEERLLGLLVGTCDGDSCLIAITDGGLHSLSLGGEGDRILPFSSIAAADIVRRRFGRYALEIESERGRVVIVGALPKLEPLQAYIRDHIWNSAVATPA